MTKCLKFIAYVLAGMFLVSMARHGDVLIEGLVRATT